MISLFVSVMYVSWGENIRYQIMYYEFVGTYPSDIKCNRKYSTWSNPTHNLNRQWYYFPQHIRLDWFHWICQTWKLILFFLNTCTALVEQSPTSSSRKAHKMATSLAAAAPELPSSTLSCLSRRLSAVDVDEVSSSCLPLCMTSKPCRWSMSNMTRSAVQRTSSTSIWDA